MLNPAQVVNDVEEEYGLRSGLVLSNYRGKAVADARAMAMYLCYKFTPYSYKEIAKFFSRDHATVIHNTTKIKSSDFKQTRTIFENRYKEWANVKKERVAKIELHNVIYRNNKFNIHKELFWKLDEAGLINWTNKDNPTYLNQRLNLV